MIGHKTYRNVLSFTLSNNKLTEKKEKGQYISLHLEIHRCDDIHRSQQGQYLSNSFQVFMYISALDLF